MDTGYPTGTMGGYDPSSINGANQGDPRLDDVTPLDFHQYENNDDNNNNMDGYRSYGGPPHNNIDTNNGVNHHQQYDNNPLPLDDPLDTLLLAGLNDMDEDLVNTMQQFLSPTSGAGGSELPPPLGHSGYSPMAEPIFSHNGTISGTTGGMVGYAGTNNNNDTLQDERGSSGAAVSYLEDHHVVLKSKLSGPTVGTTICKNQTRSVMGKKKHATDSELQFVRDSQDNFYRNKYGGNIDNCSVSFWVEKTDTNLEKGWIVEDAMMDVRYARTGRTEIPYVLASDECLRDDIRNNFGRTSKERAEHAQRGKNGKDSKEPNRCESAGSEKKRKTEPSPATSLNHHEDDMPSGNTNSNYALNVAHAFLSLKLNTLEEEAVAQAKAADVNEEAQAMLKIHQGKIEKVQTLMDEIKQQTEMTSSTTWRSTQKKVYQIYKPDSTEVVELFICHGPIVNFSPMDESIGVNAAGLVCATNESCESICGGVTLAVELAGGMNLKTDTRNLQILFHQPPGPVVRCYTGHAVAVAASPPSSYGTLNVGHVIYAVGPGYDESLPVVEEKALEADMKLRSAYEEALTLAENAQLQAVAFSLMSAGKRSNSWDPQRALRIAVDTICDRSHHFVTLKEVHLCAFTSSELAALESVANSRFGLID